MEEGNRAKQCRKGNSTEIKTKRSKARAHGRDNSAWTGCLTQLRPKSRQVQPLLSFVQTCSDCRWSMLCFLSFIRQRSWSMATCTNSCMTCDKASLVNSAYRNASHDFKCMRTKILFKKRSYLCGKTWLQQWKSMAGLSIQACCT